MRWVLNLIAVALRSVLLPMEDEPCMWIETDLAPLDPARLPLR